jgi:DNA (cytosine-5)-methyltransferase 1
MKLVDLFCGCGGFSLGAHLAGFEVSVAYDVDKVLTSSFPHNFPKTKLLHRDISTLTGDQVLLDAGCAIDGIFGGPPCQAFSNIGRRCAKDPRRELIGDFFRVVSEVRPVFFVMENVRGLVSPKTKPVLDEAMKPVVGLYDILGPIIWDAADFGAATKRQRVFVIGIRKDQKRPLQSSVVESRKRPPATVRDAIGDIGTAVQLKASSTYLDYDLWKLKPDNSENEYQQQLRARDGIFTGQVTTVHTQTVVTRFAATKPGETDPVGRHPRLSWSGQCPTLRAGTGPEMGSYQSVRPIHPEENRVITVREAARLQGFPDTHLFHKTVWHSFRMIGNSVSPIMAEVIFRSLASHLAPARHKLLEEEKSPSIKDKETRFFPAELASVSM